MKNSKIYKKLLAVVSAGMILVSGGAALAEDTKEDNKEAKYYAQMAYFNPFNSEQLENVSGEACTDIRRLIKGQLGDLENGVQSWGYLTNISFVNTKEVDGLLSVYVFDNNVAVDGINANIRFALVPINKTNVYNQITARTAKSNDELFDPSVLCYNDNDEAITHSMHENYGNAVREFVKNSTTLIEGNDAFNTLCSQLSNSSIVPEGNACDLSTGAEFNAYMTIGNNTMQLIADWFTMNCNDTIILSYFKDKVLWEPRPLEETPAYNKECLEEADILYLRYARLWPRVYSGVLNEIKTALDIQCGCAERMEEGRKIN